MEARYVEATSERRELTTEVLRGAELALKHKLRRKFSAEFVDRHGDDLIAQAAKEYAGALDRGQVIRNPGGLIVDIAYKRALDAFAKEARAPMLDELDVGAPLADPHSPQPLQELERREERSQLYEALAHLDPEERRAIALVYFEGISGREAAGPLNVSESTSLRRLRSAQAKLREWLPLIEEGGFCKEATTQLRALSEGTADDAQRVQGGLHLRNCASCREAFAQRQEFAFEVGLAAWLGLVTTRSSPVAHIGDQAVTAFDGARDSLTNILDRSRDFVTRFLSSGGGEAVGGVAGGPLAKTAAACTAVAACALTGIVGPGVGDVDIVGGTDPPRASKDVAVPPVALPEVSPPPAAPLTVAPQPSQSPVKAGGRRENRSSDTEPASSGGRNELPQSAVASAPAPDSGAESQFGIESVPAPAGSPQEPQPVAPSGQSSDQAADSQFGLR